MKKVVIINYELNLLKSIRAQIKVFHILLLKPALRRVLLKKNLKVEANKEEFKVK